MIGTQDRETEKKIDSHIILNSGCSTHWKFLNQMNFGNDFTIYNKFWETSHNQTFYFISA